MTRRSGFALATSLLAMTVATPALAGEAKKATFGTLPDGRPVPAVMLTNGHGVSARIIALGAALQSVILPDPPWPASRTSRSATTPLMVT